MAYPLPHGWSPADDHAAAPHENSSTHGYVAAAGLQVRSPTIAKALKKDNPDAPDESIGQISNLISRMASDPTGTATVVRYLLYKVGDVRGRLEKGLPTEFASIENLGAAECAEVIKHLDETEDALAGLLSVLARRGRTDVETSYGTGLGSPLSSEEAAERLERIAEVMPVERWAGEVARPSELIDRIGVARSTLDSWRQDGLAIGLPRGRRAHVYPLEQFEAGRPLPGLDAVVRAAGGNHVVAWRWLRTPHIDFDGRTPLVALKSGEIEPVAEAAARSLG